MHFSRIFPGPDRLKPQADTVGWLEPMSTAWIEDAVVVFHAMSSGLEEAMPAEGTSGRGCRQRVWPRRHCAVLGVVGRARSPGRHSGTVQNQSGSLAEAQIRGPRPEGGGIRPSRAPQFCLCVGCLGFPLRFLVLQGRS